MEENSRRRKRKGDVQKMVLASVAIAGGLTVAMVAPNVLHAMLKSGMVPVHRQNEIIGRARAQLVQRGLLAYRGRYLALTKNGEKALRMLQLREYKLQLPRKWDGRWRILIFDIPEYRRGTRTRVRTILREIGFIHLQDSVWLFPYDCEDVITLVKADLKIGKGVLYLIVDSLENDAQYRRYFQLSR